MKCFKVLRTVILILILSYIALSQEQDKTAETAEDLIIKGIELKNEGKNNEANECFQKAVKLDPSKSVYIEITEFIKDEKFEESLKRIEGKKSQSLSKKEQKIIQILLADSHFWWAETFRKNYDSQNAHYHYEVAYNIDKIYRPRDSAIDLYYIGVIYNSIGQKHKALIYYNKALPIHRKVGNRSMEATTLNNIGLVYSDLGQKQKALEYYEKALPIRREMKNRSGEGTILNNIGMVYSDLGQKQKALEYFEKALTINREVGDRSGEAIILNIIGDVYSLLGPIQKALEYYEKALPISREVGDRNGEAIVLNNIGGMNSFLGQTKKSMEYFEKALSISREIGDRSGEIIALNNIGGVYDAHGKKQIALEYFEKALNVSREVGDRNGEAISLKNIGGVYFFLGQNKKAMEYFKMALPVSHEVGDRFDEAMILNSIGNVYCLLGQKQKALEYYEKVLPFASEIGDRSLEATSLGNIGGIYNDLGQKQTALEYLEKVLTIFREVGDRAGEANTLTAIGDIYADLGLKQKALENYEKSLPIFCEAGDRSGEANNLIGIGGVYYDLGQKQKALEYCKKALPMFSEVGNRSGEANTLNNIGSIYNALGQKQKALEYYERVLPIYRELGDRPGECVTLNNIGRVYKRLNQKQEALEYYEMALLICREIGDRFGEAIILNNIGGVYSFFGQKQKALEYYERVLPIRREVGNRSGEAATLNNIGRAYVALGHSKKGFAIFCRKQAINLLQYLRQNIDTLNTETKLIYLKSKEDTYRFTASLTIDSGRLSEAQQILDILKDEEYFAYIRGDRSAYTPEYSPIDYTGFERHWLNQQNILMEKISSISRPYCILFIKPNRNPEEEKRLESLKRDLEKSQKEYSDFLALMKAEFEKHESEKDPDIDALAKKSSVLKKLLKALDQENNGKNVALHFLVHNDQISIIITTPTDQTVKQCPRFDGKVFNAIIYRYRGMIEKFKNLPRGVKIIPSSDSQIEELNILKRAIEKVLYYYIFQPVDQYLKEYSAVNLLVSLDGVLRYIPLGALWDGEYYLIQKYRFVLLTPSSLKHIAEKPVSKNKILGMGAGKGGNGFAPLPFVNREIRAIVNDNKKGCLGVINGNALIDDDFTRDNMFHRLKSKIYPFVHIASHFKFSPGDETKTQLLLGDGTIMSLIDIRKEGKLFNKVNLLVLSACETGVGGNGDEIDGFGELAQQCGAECVVASLWPVADESTKELMVRFYSLLKKGKVTSKIEALRQAQLELAGLEDLLNKNNPQTDQTTSKSNIYPHPYYWAPFIMMGNWR